MQVHAGAWLVDGWFVEKMGRGRPNPATTSLAAFFEAGREVNTEARRRNGNQ